MYQSISARIASSSSRSASVSLRCRSGGMSSRSEWITWARSSNSSGDGGSSSSGSCHSAGGGLRPSAAASARQPTLHPDPPRQPLPHPDPRRLWPARHHPPRDAEPPPARRRRAAVRRRRRPGPAVARGAGAYRGGHDRVESVKLTSSEPFSKVSAGGLVAGQRGREDHVARVIIDADDQLQILSGFITRRTVER